MRQTNAELIKQFIKKDSDLNGSGALERLAVKAKVSPTLIRKMLRNPRQGSPTLATADRLCEAMNVELDDLFPCGSKVKEEAA